MENQLAMDKVQAIKSLEAAGHSERKIAEALSISRGAVRRHLARGASKDTKAPTGEAPTGSVESTDTKAPTGSARPEDTPEHLDSGASRSLCQAYHQTILAKLEQGLTAQRIFQDLRDEQGKLFETQQQTLEFLEVHPVIRPIAEYGEFFKNAL